MKLYEIIATYEDGTDSEREQAETLKEATKIKTWYESMGFPKVEILEI